MVRSTHTQFSFLVISLLSLSSIVTGTPAQGKLGATCSSNSNCASGYYCVANPISPNFQWISPKRGFKGKCCTAQASKKVCNYSSSRGCIKPYSCRAPTGAMALRGKCLGDIDSLCQDSTTCRTGLSCIASNQMPPSSTNTGRCFRVESSGSLCNTVKGPGCQSGLLCVDKKTNLKETSGICLSDKGSHCDSILNCALGLVCDNEVCKAILSLNDNCSDANSVCYSSDKSLSCVASTDSSEQSFCKLNVGGTCKTDNQCASNNCIEQPLWPDYNWFSPGPNLIGSYYDGKCCTLEAIKAPCSYKLNKGCAGKSSCIDPKTGKTGLDGYCLGNYRSLCQDSASCSPFLSCINLYQLPPSSSNVGKCFNAVSFGKDCDTSIGPGCQSGLLCADKTTKLKAISGICLTDKGSQCDSNLDCALGLVCHNEVCKKILSLNDNCSDASSFCFSSDNSLTCVASTDSSEQSFCKSNVGGSCTVDSDCLSNLICGGITGSMKCMSPPSPPGGLCSSDLDCDTSSPYSSNECETSSGYCVSKCENDAQCFTPPNTNSVSSCNSAGFCTVVPTLDNCKTFLSYILINIVKRTLNLCLLMVFVRAQAIASLGQFVTTTLELIHR